MLPELAEVLAETESPETSLDNVLSTRPPAADENSFSFGAQSAAHAAALQTGILGTDAAAEAITAPQTFGNDPLSVTDRNANFAQYGSGIVPEAYDPTALKNVNDNPIFQAARISEDKQLGLFKPIAYDPSSLQHVNDSPVARAVNLFASGAQPATRRDMRYQFMPESNPNPPALPGAYPAPSNLVSNETAKKKKKTVGGSLGGATPYASTY